MNTDKINFYRSESRRIYNYLITKFCSRFKWINKNAIEESNSNLGLATVLMDDYITPQVISAIKEGKLTQKDLIDFFDLLEELLMENDNHLKDVLCTTIIEALSSEESLNLDVIFPYCGSETRNAIFNSLQFFYNKKNRIAELKMKFPWTVIIKLKVFLGLDRLNKVIYPGNEEDWEKVVLSDDNSIDI